MKVLLRASILVVILAFVTAVVFVNSSASPQSDATLNMRVPGFIQVVHAAPQNNIGAILDDEAGFSAYYQTLGPIDLNRIRNQFLTIALDEAEYILGTVDMPDYTPEAFDPHVYVHVDGWVLAYYKTDDPAAKAFDTLYFEENIVSRTKFSRVLENIVVASQQSWIEANTSYYDFRYPNATHVLFIAENDNFEGDTFTFTLPAEFVYFETSAISQSGYTLNGDQRCCYSYVYDIIQPLVSVGVEHSFKANDTGAFVVVYREVQ